MEEGSSPAARIWIDDEGIFHDEADGGPSTKESVAEGSSAIRRLGGASLIPILFDARGWRLSDPSSWVQFISTIESVCPAA